MDTSAQSKPSPQAAPADELASDPTESALNALAVCPEEDEGHCEQVMSRLAAEYEKYVQRMHVDCPACPVAKWGPFMFETMLDYKASYGDGELGRWDESDVHEYLLDYVPRKVSAGMDMVGAAPACVRDYFYFMADRGTFAGGEDRASALGDLADELFDEFASACGNPRRWGMAKQMVMGRDSDFAPAAGESSARRPSSATRKRRKAVRTARRRNRR